PCYEKMMLIVPHVAEQLGDEVFAQWFDATCPADVRQLAMEADTEGRYESAIEVLKTVQSLAESRKLKGAKAVAEDVAGLEFMKQMLDARKQYEEDVKTPGDRRQAHIFLGIMALTRDADMDAALQHLRASEEPKAAQLADRLTGFKSNLSNTENAYQLAQATIALADDLEAAYLKLLLYKEAEGKLAACLAEPSFANRNARQIAALQQRTSEKSQQAMNQLPPLVRDRLKTVRQEASTDSEYVQTFFGVPLKNANSVVYVVDKSGSMTDSIMYCKEELLRAVYSLKDKQQFQILFYSTGPALAMGNGELTAATEENKKTARKFVGSVMPVGQTDPSDALRRAFRLRPDTIYLLTDGEFDKSIPKLIRGMNSAGKVTVNTVCFLYSNGEPMLKEIAQDNNGTYRYVSEDDLSNLKQMNQPP
ncbi:MAG: VWA domain-containing protein, partial [Planctomycetes bacterium]|nr:VWA domain-containing protein [Planctomycetota bacterium]